MATTIQTGIEQYLNKLVADDLECGLQVVVYHNGQLVVDAVAGFTGEDPATASRVTGETLFPVFSTGKGITATAAHLVVDRGLIDYDTPIAAVWPEFAAHGKERITLRHALGHTAGLSAVPSHITHEDVCDWRTICDALAEASPASEPGEQILYHAMTFGWLVGEVVSRVDGRTFADFVHDEISSPLGLENDLFFGIPEEAQPRVATLSRRESPLDPGVPPPAPNPAIPLWRGPLHAWMNLPETRRACIPGAAGIMNARAIARHYAVLLPGGVDGVELLPPKRVRIATAPKLPRPVMPVDAPHVFTLGYIQGGEGQHIGPEPEAFGHGGFGGSLGFANPASKLAVGITKNRFHDGKDTALLILERLHSVLHG